jgi:hypothetical protein
MYPFTSTTLSYDLVQDRRRSFEQAASRHRLVRASVRAARAGAPVARPPGPAPEPVPLLTFLNADSGVTPASPISGLQHLPAAPVSEPTTVRVA